MKSRLHGCFEGADDGALAFSDDLPARLELVEAGFGQRLKLMAGAYIEAAGVDAPAAGPSQVAGFPGTPARG